jgi:hypothetical protein
MKTNLFITIATATFGLAAFSSTGCAAEEKKTEASSPPVVDVAATAVMAAPSGSGSVVPAAASPDVTSAQWSDIENYTYDMRVQFRAGLKRLEARVDAQLSELTTKRATMKGTAETKDWDFAMKEMRDARAYLKSMADEVSTATDETWAQAKAKVGQAWVRTQAAYDKVKHSTTS